MPIRPEMRELYPPEWSLISDCIRFDRALGRCECDGRCGGRFCRARLGITDRCPNYHGDPNVWTGSKVVLTTMHLDHDPTNCAPSNLMAGCQSCHLAYDRDHHAATRAANREKRETQMSIGDYTEDEAPKTPQQMAAEVVAAHFDTEDPGTSAAIDQIVAALDEVGILVDPVDNAMWQNLKAGHMSCHYENGGLLFSMTEAGNEHARALIQKATDSND